MVEARTLILKLAAAILRGGATNPDAQRLLFNAIRLQRPEIAGLRDSLELQFLAYCFLKRGVSKAQILQDLWVCFMTQEKQNGYFVEFGSTNGLMNSNTWLLEKALHWNGILAEPNPLWHADLARNRAAHIDHRCVASETGATVTFLVTDESDPELSAIADFADGDHFADVRQQGRKMQVDTIGLNDLLNFHNAPTDIDYISIDTEGSEFEILSAFDFARWRVSLFSVEQNRITEPKIQMLLERQGYVRILPNLSQWDGWYVLRESERGPQSAGQRNMLWDRPLAARS